MGFSPPFSKRRISRWFCGRLKFVEPLFFSESPYFEGTAAVGLKVQGNWALPHQRRGPWHQGAALIQDVWWVSDTGFSDRVHDGYVWFCGWKCSNFPGIESRSQRFLNKCLTPTLADSYCDSYSDSSDRLAERSVWTGIRSGTRMAQWWIPELGWAYSQGNRASTGHRSVSQGRCV